VSHQDLSRGQTRLLKRAYGDLFFFPIFKVAERNGLVSAGKEVVTGAAVRVWKGYEMRSRQCRSGLT
jgi:hypothetical protein